MHVLVLGAGQLARMMALDSAPLGIEIRAYDVRSHTVVHPLTWHDYGDDLSTGLAKADVVTAEFEHIPNDILDAAEASGKFLPGAEAIRVGGDRRKEKALLDRVGVANAPYQVIESIADLHAAVDNIGLPLILKSALDGYDGKGQWRLKEEAGIEQLWQELSQFLQNNRSDQAIIAEAWIPFDREVSIIGVRDKSGQSHCYALTENHHHDGILILSIAPVADEHLQTLAQDAFEKITNDLDYVGVMAIEFFAVGDRLLVNELAPRVHNSGHWTQQGCFTSQFESHIRAVTGLPIASLEPIQPTAMINMIGIDHIPDIVFKTAGAHPHWYDKEARTGRKMGHINLISADLSVALEILSKKLSPEDFAGLQTAVTKYLNK